MQRAYITGGLQMPQYQAQPILHQPKKQQKALVGFGQVPKFVPPTYDNVAPDDLPCPDTPSPRGSLSSQNGVNDNDQDLGDVVINNNRDTHNLHGGAQMNIPNNLPQDNSNNNYNNNSSTSLIQQNNNIGSGGDQRVTTSSQQGGGQNSSGGNANSNPNQPGTSGSQNNGGRSSRSRGANNASNQPDIKPFPPGTFVEYRSRTMQDRWILAKVENYDEKNRVYRLDVQPKAPWDRVRLRQNKDPEPSDRPQRSESRQFGESENANATSGARPTTENSSNLNNNNNNTSGNLLPSLVNQASGNLNTANNSSGTANNNINNSSNSNHPMLQDLHLLNSDQLQKRVIDLVSENQNLKRQLESEKAEVANLRRQIG